MPEPVPCSVTRAVEQIAQRNMALPSLVFGVAFAPMRFVLAQLLLAAVPFAGLVGLDIVEEWAVVLDDTASCRALRQTLEDAAD